MLTRVSNTIYRFYFLTLVFILILFKRAIPKWMQKKTQEVLEPAIPFGEVQKYER